MKTETDVFHLPEGACYLQLPSRLSIDDVRDLEAYWWVLRARLRRESLQPRPTDLASTPGGREQKG